MHYLSHIECWILQSLIFTFLTSFDSNCVRKCVQCRLTSSSCYIIARLLLKVLVYEKEDEVGFEIKIITLLLFYNAQ